MNRDRLWSEEHPWGNILQQTFTHCPLLPSPCTRLIDVKGTTLL